MAAATTCPCCGPILVPPNFHAFSHSMCPHGLYRLWALASEAIGNVEWRCCEVCKNSLSVCPTCRGSGRVFNPPESFQTETSSSLSTPPQDSSIT